MSESEFEYESESEAESNIGKDYAVKMKQRVVRITIFIARPIRFSL